MMGHYEALNNEVYWVEGRERKFIARCINAVMAEKIAEYLELCREAE